MSEVWLIEFRVGWAWQPGHLAYTSEDAAVAALRRVRRGLAARVARYGRDQLVMRHRYTSKPFREKAWLWVRCRAPL